MARWKGTIIWSVICVVWMSIVYVVSYLIGGKWGAAIAESIFYDEK